MSLDIVLIEVAQLGLLATSLWIPFRMGCARMKRPWPMLAGWAALLGVSSLLMSISLMSSNGRYPELAKVLPEGPHLLIALLFGWVPGYFLGTLGEKRGQNKL